MRHEITHSAKSGRLSYPWDNMDVGDYFEVPFDSVTENNIRMQAYFRKKKTGEFYAVTKDLSAFRVTRRK